MLAPVTTNKFEKDLRKMIKRGKSVAKLKTVMRALIEQKTLARKHLDHSLVGNYANRRECHIEPDWLLIYKLDLDSIIFERTGSHADLFK